MFLKMSIRIIQSSREADPGSVDVPWAASNGAEVQSDLSMGILVTIEVPLSSFAGPAALEVAHVRQRVCFDVAAR